MLYNVSGATFTVTLFFAVFSAGKTCIYAVLSVIFRHLGLSPFQAGILRGIQSVIGSISTPSMVCCSGRMTHRRIMMILCIFLTMSAYLVLLVMTLPVYTCFHHIPSTCNAFPVSSQNISGVNQNLSFTTLANFGKRSPIIENQNNHLNSSMETTSQMPTSPKPTKNVLERNQTLLTTTEHFLDYENEISSHKPHFQRRQEPTKNKTQDSFFLRQPDENDYSDYYAETEPPKKHHHHHKKIKKHQNIERYKRNTDNPNPQHFNKFWPNWDMSCLVTLLIILFVGEFFCAPVESIASSTWFIYLDEIDHTQNHSKHLSYIPIATALTMILIGLINLIGCSVFQGHAYYFYHINFYMFGCLMGVSVLTTYFFPIPQLKNLPISNYCHGNLAALNFFFQDLASALLLVTVILNGAFSACLWDFSLWYIEDMNGTQVQTNMAVGFLFFSDAFGNLMVGFLSRKISANTLIIVGTLVHGLQLFLFPVIQNPWGLVITQFSNCFSSVFFWKGILILVKRSCTIRLEKKIIRALQTFHSLFGYTLGTVLSGFLYSFYNPKLMFFAFGGTALGWGILLFLAYCTFHLKMQRNASMGNALEEQVGLFSVNSDREDED